MSIHQSNVLGAYTTFNEDGSKFVYREVDFHTLFEEQKQQALKSGYSPSIYIDESEALYGQTCWEIDNYQDPNTQLADELLTVISSIQQTEELENEEDEQYSIDEEIVLKVHQLSDMYGNLYYTRIVTFDRLLNDDECFEYKQQGYLPAQDRHPVEFYRCD